MIEERWREMKLQLIKEKKIILLWKMKEEEKKDIPEEIQREINKYKEKKFKLIIMCSGKSDLFETMNELIIRNYKQMVSKSVGDIA